MWSQNFYSAREDGHFCQRWPFSGTKKWHFGCPNWNSETTFISPIFLQWNCLWFKSFNTFGCDFNQFLDLAHFLPFYTLKQSELRNKNVSPREWTGHSGLVPSGLVWSHLVWSVFKSSDQFGTIKPKCCGLGYLWPAWLQDHLTVIKIGRNVNV